MDVNGKSTTIPFNVVEGRSPLSLGLDVDNYANSHNRGSQKSITILRPDIDTRPRDLSTYIGPDQTSSERKRMEILPHKNLTVTTLMSNVDSRYEMNLAKPINMYTHAIDSKRINLFRDAGILHARNVLLHVMHARAHGAKEAKGRSLCRT